MKIIIEGVTNRREFRICQVFVEDLLDQMEVEMKACSDALSLLEEDLMTYEHAVVYWEGADTPILLNSAKVHVKECLERITKLCETPICLTYKNSKFSITVERTYHEKKDVPRNQ